MFLFTILLVVGISVIVMGTIFLIISLVFKSRNDKLYLNCTMSTLGVFDDIKCMSIGMNDVYSYFPVYCYQVNGLIYKCQGTKGVGKDIYVDRNNVVIYYNPNNPNEYFIDKKVSNNLVVVFVIVGIVLLIIGLLIILIDLYVV